jgi:hypothetical protein
LTIARAMPMDMAAALSRRALRLRALSGRGRLAASLLACAAVSAAVPADAAVASSAQMATITASFSPLRLGAPTTVKFGFAIRAANGGLPSALTGIDFRYPRALALGTSELGQATCQPRRLQLLGPAACPANSIMGAGSALAKFQVSPIVSHEQASLALVAGPPRGGHVNMLIAATGEYPVETRIVMSALLEPGRFHIAVPLVAGIPEGPDVAVVSVQATLGGRLTYYERRGGRRVAYRPTGVLLPRRCPRGGFRFSATFAFLDGSHAQAQTAVRCPR